MNPQKWTKAKMTVPSILSDGVILGLSGSLDYFFGPELYQ